MPCRRFLLAFTLSTALAAGSARAQFVDRTGPAGLNWFQTTWGTVLADLDDDGQLDLVVGHHQYVPRLYWNEADGTFNANIHPQPWSGPIDRHGMLATPLGSQPRVDLFVTHGAEGGVGSEANELYRNDGGGTFTVIPGAQGMADADGRTRCVSGADYDGDTRVDLWVGKAPAVGSANSLFHNDNGSFSDVAAAVGLAETEGTVGGIWGDFDDDGDPDLLVGGEEFPRPTRLWRNDGGTFADASSIFSPPLPVVSGADWGDMDGDGDIDLAVCDGQTGLFDTFAEGDSITFFFNTRYADTGLDGMTVPSLTDTTRAIFRFHAFPDNDLVFLGPSGVHPDPGVIKLTDAYVGAPSFTPGVDLGVFVWRSSPGGKWEVRCSTPNVNYDVWDGWLTNGAPLHGVVPVALDDPGFVPGAPRVWRNDGGAFTEVSAALGLPAAMVNPRDLSWIDYDNDGDLDLHVVDMGTSAQPNAPDALFRNDGATFADVTAEEGLSGSTSGLGDGAVWGDIDRDGDLDVYVAQGAGPLTFSAFAPALFLSNEGPRGNSIQVDLIGRGQNAAAVGAVVTVVTPQQRVVRRVSANAWRGFQDPLRVHLGLGEAATADTLLLHWPSGREQVYLDVPAGIYRLFEGLTAPIGVPSVAPSPLAGWSIAGPWPQPSGGLQTMRFASPREETMTVGVYDVAGRLVRELHRGPLEGGHAVAWDGRDERRRPVPSGVYLARFTDGRGNERTVRCVRVR